MGASDIISTFAAWGAAPEDASLSIAGDKLVVEGWFPAALRLGSATCLVRTDDGPRPGLGSELASALSAAGLIRIETDLEAPVLAVAMQRLDVIAAQWEVWSSDEDTARTAVNAAAVG